MKKLLAAICAYFKREPDFIIGNKENPYLLRWYLIPRNKYFNIYLHKFLRDDDDRALHDHPWKSLSILISGSYMEHLPGGKIRFAKKGNIIFRQADHQHRIELHKKTMHVHQHTKNGLEVIREKVSLPAWTIFITGRKIRQWGFWCDGTRFVHWKEFTDPKNSGLVGKGCGE